MYFGGKTCDEKVYMVISNYMQSVRIVHTNINMVGLTSSIQVTSKCLLLIVN